jgi:hypothetical protein
MTKTKWINTGEKKEKYLTIFLEMNLKKEWFVSKKFVLNR